MLGLKIIYPQGKGVALGSMQMNFAFQRFQSIIKIKGLAESLHMDPQTWYSTLLQGITVFYINIKVYYITVHYSNQSVN